MRHAGFPINAALTPLYEEAKPVYNMWEQVVTIVLRGVHTTQEQNMLINNVCKSIFPTL